MLKVYLLDDKKSFRFEYLLILQEWFLPGEGGQALEGDTQGGGGVSVSGGVQEEAGRGTQCMG